MFSCAFISYGYIFARTLRYLLITFTTPNMPKIVMEVCLCCSKCWNYNWNIQKQLAQKLNRNCLQCCHYKYIVAKLQTISTIFFSGHWTQHNTPVSISSFTLFSHKGAPLCWSDRRSVVLQSPLSKATILVYSGWLFDTSEDFQWRITIFFFSFGDVCIFQIQLKLSNIIRIRNT